MRVSNFEEENEISEFSKQLKNTFYWFDAGFTKSIADSSSDFWDGEIGCRLAALSENVNILAPSDEYFVTQIRLNRELSVFIRVSKTMVRNLLEGVLGISRKSFNIEKLTELEAKILTEFNNFVYSNFQQMVLKGNALPRNNTNYNECNLTYFFQDEYQSLGKLIITIPIVAIRPEAMQIEEDTFSIHDFPFCKADMNIEVGKTRIKLSDLKQLEVDDVVLLERSRANEMTLHFDGVRKKFRVAPNPTLMINYNDNETNGGNSMSSNDIYVMWDTIQVELGAEFEKVKLSLGELKQISEGLVVDVGSVYDNKIDLKVEDKIIASGELVIINDRYGVRINEIFTEEKNSASQSAEQYDTPSAPVPSYTETYQEAPAYQEESVQNTPQEEDEFKEEDFDYSDFDVDEEDI